MAKEIRDIETSEVSVVDKAANKKKFLFFKREGDVDLLSKQTDTKIVVESDGTVVGTKISVGGKDLGKLRDFYLSFYGEPSSNSDAKVSCSYTQIVETADGFSRTETFSLSKGDYVMNDTVKELLKMFFGDKDLVIEKAATGSEAVEMIKQALTTIGVYKKDFPEDLEKAIGTLVKRAALSLVEKEQPAPAPAKGADQTSSALPEEVQNKVNALTAAIGALNAVLPVKKGQAKTDPTDLEKAMAELSKGIQALEKKEQPTDSDTAKALTALSARLETLEKTTGVKKGLDGQESSATDGEKKMWPSLVK